MSRTERTRPQQPTNTAAVMGMVDEWAARTVDRARLPRLRGRQHRWPLASSLPLLLLLCALLASPFASGILLSEIPPNTANRTLTHISIPRTYPLTEGELQSLGRREREALQRDPYRVLAFQTPNLNNSDIRRAVIVIHGAGRDGWLYIDQANEALYQATRNANASPDRADIRKLKRYQTMIIAPTFVNDDDAELVERTTELQFDDEQDLSTYDGLPSETTLQWSGNSWALGGDSIAPTEIGKRGRGDPSKVRAPAVSSYEVMDALIAQLVDKSVYPNLDTIIVAGHSLGAQYVQRYALIGAVPSRAVSVHFFIANPGSYAYLSPERPRMDVVTRAVGGCLATYDRWKYGLGIFGIRYLYDVVIDSLDTKTDVTDVRVRYLRDRQVHYLQGLADTAGQGDRSCSAMAQGDTHLERGRNFAAHINATADAMGLPHAHTIDYIPGVGHDGLGMFASRAGVRRLFLPNIDGNESAQGVGYADVDFYRYPYRFRNGAPTGRLHGGVYVVLLSSAFVCLVVLAT